MERSEGGLFLGYGGNWTKLDGFLPSWVIHRASRVGCGRTWMTQGIKGGFMVGIESELVKGFLELWRTVSWSGRSLQLC